MKIKPWEIVNLERGGYLIDTNTSHGYIQIGSPPETIKDTMGFPKGVPKIFCLPQEFFNREKGISVAEVEFPLYFNFFINKQKTTIICDKENIPIFQSVLKESLFGPDDINLQIDYDEENYYRIPNLKEELSFFRSGLQINTLVDFKSFDEEGKIDLGEVCIAINGKNFDISENNSEFNVSVPREVHYNVTFDIGAAQLEPYKPSTFAVTCLGPSHGFDPLDNTSGFIIWINKRGIMVDPPVNSTEWLLRSNVNPKLIDGIILTHTHADHDAGTFQKILEQEKITIYSTKTIMDSWIRKYSTLAGISPKELSSLFNFHPVLIHNKFNINGAWITFNYSLHSIPTIGFRISFKEKSLVYTSDHLHHPETYKDLYQKGILNTERYNELMSFPWDSDIIYHEAGVPPLHTPIDYLNSIDVNLQKKMVIYHIAKKDFPKRTKLTLATFGIANTIELNVKKTQFTAAYEILDILSRIEYFKNFSAEQIRDIVSVVEKEYIPQGTQIIKKGEIGDKFFIIVSGNTCVGESKTKNFQSQSAKRYGAYQCFGETSLILNTPRTADVYAETDVDALTIDKESFINIISGTEIEKKLKFIAMNRDEESWQTLQETKLFTKLTSSQKTELEMILKRCDFKKGEALFEKGKKSQNLFIYHSGKLLINGEYQEFKRGDFVGSYTEFEKDLVRSNEIVAMDDCLLFSLEKKGFDNYIRNNPGVYLRFFESID